MDRREFMFGATAALGLTPNLKMQFLSPQGVPIAGGRLYTYAAGTSTPLATYTDNTGQIQNANPVILDSKGEAAVWLGTSVYALTLKNSAGAIVWSAENVSGVTALSSLATSGGSAFIGFLQLGKGSVPTNVQTKLREDVSVLDFGADPTGMTPCDTAINNAIASFSDGNGTVYFPPGTYKVISTITVSKNRIHLVGAGTYATTILFAPVANGSCFKLSAGTSVLYQGSICGMTFYSKDSTFTKVALELSDISTYSISEIVVGGSVVVGGSKFWSGGSGSIGIQCKGREATSVGRVNIFADKPIVISQNPNSISISLDHFHFHDLYLGANGNPCVTVVDTGFSGVYLTNIAFDGYQAWVLGTYGFYWNDKTSKAISANISISNVRTEQGTSTSAYQIYISHNYSLQGLILNNWYGGLEPRLRGSRNGIYLRNVQNVTLIQYSYVGKSEAMNVDMTCRSIRAIGCFWQAGSTATLIGQTTDFALAKKPSTGALSSDFFLSPSAKMSNGITINAPFMGSTVTIDQDAAAVIGGAQFTLGYLNVTTDEDVGAIYFLKGAKAGTVEINDFKDVFTDTKDSPASYNIYYDAGSASYVIQNKRTGTRKVKYILLGGNRPV